MQHRAWLNLGLHRGWCHNSQTQTSAHCCNTSRLFPATPGQILLGLLLKDLSLVHTLDKLDEYNPESNNKPQHKPTGKLVWICQWRSFFCEHNRLRHHDWHFLSCLFIYDTITFVQLHDVFGKHLYCIQVVNVYGLTNLRLAFSIFFSTSLFPTCLCAPECHIARLSHIYSYSKHDGCNQQTAIDVELLFH